jgi:hypothetical protein
VSDCCINTLIKICCNLNVSICNTIRLSFQLKIPSADETGRGARTNYRGPKIRKGAGVRYVAYVFVFLGRIIVCLLYELTLSDHAQVTLKLRQSFWFSINNFSRPALVGVGGGGAKQFFNRGPNPLSAALKIPTTRILKLLTSKYYFIHNFRNIHNLYT